MIVLKKLWQENMSLLDFWFVVIYHNCVCEIKLLKGK